jgi:hypothetical protein
MASNAAKFTINNCIFTSSALPVGSYYELTELNEFNTVANSPIFEHFNTHYCPAATPAETQLRTSVPTRSSLFTRPLGQIYGRVRTFRVFFFFTFLV